MAPSAFKNEPLADFSRPTDRKAFEDALSKVRSRLGREYPIVIGGKAIRTRNQFKSCNPSKPSEVIGLFQVADSAIADMAVESAARAFETWKSVKPSERASLLFKAAAAMRARKHEFSAALVLEIGKTWNEADGDTVEAIDFLEFYGREMLRLGGPQPLVKITTEKNELRYIPIGVGVVVPPWNFAVGILVGMTSAAVVTGNAVVLKPSSDSPFCGWMFFELMREVGLPDGVINFLTGPGGSVGDTLVAHPKTRFVAFTGSKETGIRINELAAKVQPGQIWLKRVMAEMGGKDAIIIDDEIDDLGAAVEATVVSAFGYQGQKCSAASRVIVVEGMYEEFVEHLKRKVEKIVVGPAEDPSSYMGPVINRAAQKRILEYIRKGVDEGGRLLAGGEAIDGEGYFIEATLISDVQPDSTIAQEEIFGPVLSVMKARDFDHALLLANNTEFGLTGGVWTANREKIEKAKDAFHVGNFYVNRKITGVSVGVHPFGGFNMSGTAAKAGGHDYLLWFVQAKLVSEVVR